MPNNTNTHNFLHTIASAPGLYKYGGVALLVVIGAGWLSGGGSTSHTPRPANPPSLLSGLSAGAAQVGEAAAYFPPLPPVPKGVKSLTDWGGPPAPAAATSVAQPPVQAGPLTLPAQTPPGTPVSGHAEIAMAAAALPPYGVPASFQSLGRAQVREHIASFTVDAPKPLRAVAPSNGLIRLRWRTWLHASKPGAYTLVASIGGGDLRNIEAFVDGQQTPVLQGTREVCNAFNGCPPTSTTVAGAAMLSPGWHEIEVSAVAAATGAPRPAVTLFVRAPGADAPAALVPSWPAASKPSTPGSAP